MEIVEWRDVEPSTVWRHEAHDFTPWLAENLDRIGQAIGLDLELEATERPVGSFSADILAKTTEGDVVVVENQLHRSDHSHLGQLITYAAGLDAAHVIWIAATFRDEYLTALQWLNENSREDLAFYALELLIVSVGDDQVAVRLYPRLLPDWTAKAAKDTASGLSPTQQAYQAFWAQLLTELKEVHPGWTTATKPASDSWMTLPAGSSQVWYSLVFSGNGRFRIELTHQPKPGSTSEPFFSALAARRGSIEAEFGQPLTWEPLEDLRTARVSYSRPGSIRDEEDLDDIRRWAVEYAGRFRDVIQPHVDELIRTVL
jgi:hypothetical protein